MITDSGQAPTVCISKYCPGLLGIVDEARINSLPPVEPQDGFRASTKPFWGSLDILDS